MSIAENTRHIRQTIAHAPQVTLIAVAKTFTAAAVREAAGCGIRHIGENFLQEASAKIADCRQLPLVWHYLGAIQRNKTEKIATLFDWVHGVDRLIIAQRLSQARAGQANPINIFLQVNIDGEASKSGVSVQDALPLAQEIAALKNLRLRGLMAIPSPKPNAEQLATFRQVAALQQTIVQSGVGLDCLSMGMSGDYLAAVQAGATHIRIGTGIFGERVYR